ncbi:MAG: type II toxin-antitoxin system VapB family antitoxin [bacterium]|nr:type II toxin-antitoxin system VapB family antitoxin [bacterium]
MAMNIKNAEVERLAAEVAGMAGESKTEAVRKALLERKARLVVRRAGDTRAARLMRFLESEAWPQIPDTQLGRRMTRIEEDEILGYGEHGV